MLAQPTTGMSHAPAQYADLATCWPDLEHKATLSGPPGSYRYGNLAAVKRQLTQLLCPCHQITGHVGRPTYQMT